MPRRLILRAARRRSWVEPALRGAGTDALLEHHQSAVAPLQLVFELKVVSLLLFATYDRCQATNPGLLGSSTVFRPVPDGGRFRPSFTAPGCRHRPGLRTFVAEC